MILAPGLNGRDDPAADRIRRANAITEQRREPAPEVRDVPIDVIERIADAAGIGVHDDGIGWSAAVSALPASRRRPHQERSRRPV